MMEDWYEETEEGGTQMKPVRWLCLVGIVAIIGAALLIVTLNIVTLNLVNCGRVFANADTCRAYNADIPL